MKYKFWKVIGLFITLFATSTVAFGSYTIINMSVGSFGDVTTPETNTTKELCEITYKYNDGANKEVKEYYNKNYVLTSDDLPILTASDGVTYYSWTDNNGKVFNPFSSTENSYTVSTNAILTGTQVKKISTAQEAIKEVKVSENKNNISPIFTTSNNVTTVDLNQTIPDTTSGNASDMEHVNNDVTLSGVLNNTNINGKYAGYDTVGKKEEYINVTHNNLSIRSNQIQNDEYIALSDKTSPISDYKPFAGPNSDNINYCSNRITLASDVILNSSNLTLGAKVGFWGSTETWSQINMQGFIIGSYTELDLNGHNLILNSGSALTAFGSITNSKPDSGKIIARSGSIIYSTFVYENQSGERSIPIQYSAGGELLDMYRMPYMNCRIRIEHGAILKGMFKLDYGGRNAGDYVEADFNLIGPDNSYIVQTGNDGYIERYVNFDKDCSLTDFEKKNILNQRIYYEFHNFKGNNSIKINSAFCKLDIGSKFNVDLGKNGYMIAPYFQLYLYNTDMVLYTGLTFMTGSYMFVDENSVINLSAGQIRTLEVPAEVDLVNTIWKYLYQTIGFLNFSLEKFKYTEAVSGDKGWVNDDFGDNSGRGGNTTRIYRDSSNFFSYLNKNRQAKCDLYGKIAISDIPEYDPNNKLGLKHYIGGNINIKDIDTFKNTINSRTQNDVCCFASSAHVGPCTATDFALRGHRVNITDFYISPIISNGNVITDMNNNYKIRNDYADTFYNYDYTNGIVETNTNELYAFIHCNAQENAFNNDSSKIRKVNNSNDQLPRKKKQLFKNQLDSYHGKYFKVTKKIDGIINCPSVNNGKGSNLYMLFRGAFVPCVENNASGVTEYSISITKFRAEKSNLGPEMRVMTFVNSDNYYWHPVWRVK